VPDDRPSFGQALADAGDSDSGSFESPVESTEAVAADASASSAEAPPTDGTPAAAPTAPPATGESPATPGPLPFEAHKRILDGAYAERDSLKAENDRLAWARDIQPDQVDRVVDLVTRANGDPVNLFLELGSDLMGNPETAAAIRSQAARFLGMRAPATPQPSQTPAPAGTDYPEPSMVIDGMALYSPEAMQQMAQAIESRILAAVTPVVGEQIAPVATLAQRLQAAEAHQRATEQAQASAKTVLDDAAKWPGFSEHKTTLATALGAEMASGRWKDEEVGHALRHLYITTVVPTLVQSGKADLLRDMRHQANTLGQSPAGVQRAAHPTNGRRPTFQEALAGQ
jgi:hypothetical protein